jgi:hypothetical protein
MGISGPARFIASATSGSWSAIFLEREAGILRSHEEFAMSTLKNDITVAVYDWHCAAERAVLALQRAGCNMQRISLVGPEDPAQERALGFLDTRDRARVCGKLGEFWGGLAQLLLQAAAVFIPARGYVFVLGPLAAANLSHLAGALLGDRNALLDAMRAIGIPNMAVPRYESALNANEFLLVAHGDQRDAYHVRELLETSGSVSFDHLRVAGGSFRVG